MDNKRKIDVFCTLESINKKIKLYNDHEYIDENKIVIENLMEQIKELQCIITNLMHQIEENKTNIILMNDITKKNDKYNLYI